MDLREFLGGLLVTVAILVRVGSYLSALLLMWRGTWRVRLLTILLTVSYLAFGWGALVTASALTGEHYDYSDFGSAPLDEMFLVYHTGLAACTAAILARRRGNTASYVADGWVAAPI